MTATNETEIRSVTVRARVTPTIYDQLRNRAEEFNTSMSELMINGALGIEVNVDAKYPTVNKELKNELKAEGNNLNQLLLELRRNGGSNDLEKEVRKTLFKINEKLDSI